MSRAIVESRWALARGHRSAGRLDEATEEYAWLWKHMVEYDPATYGVRHTFLVKEIELLVAAHRPARERFTEIRGAVTPPETRRAAGHLIKALRAAGRIEEAIAVTAEARSLDHSAALDAAIREAERTE